MFAEMRPEIIHEVMLLVHNMIPEVLELSEDMRDHIVHDVLLESIGVVKVSTVQISSSRNIYETCLFWNSSQPGEAERYSEVVERYADKLSAVEGHRKWIRQEAVARAIMSVQRENENGESQ